MELTHKDLKYLEAQADYISDERCRENKVPNLDYLIQKLGEKLKERGVPLKPEFPPNQLLPEF